MTINCPCLDCGESIQIKMKDGEVICADPPGLVGYVSAPFRKWFADLPFA